jgi:hypothetical protein
MVRPVQLVLGVIGPFLLVAAVGCPQGGNSGPPPGPDLGGGPPSPIKEIMGKLTKGPESLTPMLHRELQEENPPWEMIQGQTQEFARLAAALGTHMPPRGSPESWARLTGEYAEAAAALDQAARARDREAAVAAHRKLSGSCKGCHDEHRLIGRPGG